MKKTYVFLFPGQGSQFVGMGKDFYQNFSSARRTFEEAEDLLGYKLTSMVFEGPVELLTQTKHAQVAIYVTSTALAKVLSEEFSEISPSICAGLSLGEYSALCAAKKISFQDGLLLVQKRAKAMHEACEKHKGTMAALLGGDLSEIEKVVLSMQEKGEKIWVANYNCPGQVVISGSVEGILQATESLKEKGVKKIIPLQVHGAFHSGLMHDAQICLESELKACKLVDSPIELVMNVPGDFVSDLEKMRNFLIQQVTQSVFWEKGIHEIEKRKVDGYLEIGCGKTLLGFNKKIGVTVPSYSLEKIADLELLKKGF